MDHTLAHRSDGAVRHFIGLRMFARAMEKTSRQRGHVGRVRTKGSGRERKTLFVEDNCRRLRYAAAERRYPKSDPPNMPWQCPNRSGAKE
jgi:hypothetical protein